MGKIERTYKMGFLSLWVLFLLIKKIYILQGNESKKMMWQQLRRFMEGKENSNDKIGRKIVFRRRKKGTEMKKRTKEEETENGKGTLGEMQRKF